MYGNGATIGTEIIQRKISATRNARIRVRTVCVAAAVGTTAPRIVALLFAATARRWIGATSWASASHLPPSEVACYLRLQSSKRGGKGCHGEARRYGVARSFLICFKLLILNYLCEKALANTLNDPLPKMKPPCISVPPRFSVEPFFLRATQFPIMRYILP
jgi:hypothetical protein